MLYGWKENSMLTNCLAACAHLTITVSEIERDIGRKSSFFTTLAFDALIRGGGGGSRRNSATPFGMEKTKMAWLPHDEKISQIFVLTELTNVTDRQTDGQADTACRHIPRLCIASRGKNVCYWCSLSTTAHWRYVNNKKLISGWNRQT